MDWILNNVVEPGSTNPFKRNSAVVDTSFFTALVTYIGLIVVVGFR